MQSIKDELRSSGFRETLINNLNKSFDEALEDPDFKDLVSKLKIERKYVINYTAMLEDSKVEYSNCKKCKNILECKNKITGHCYIPKVENNNLIFEYRSCKYYKALQKEKAYQKNTYFFDVPDDIKNASIKDLYTNDKDRFETIEVLHKFIKSYPKNHNIKGLYLNGNFGCGKTYLISASFNELAHNGVKTAIVFWPEYLLDLKSSFQDDFKGKYEYIKTVPLLLIDDIGAENNTDWSRDDILCPLIQYRMENHLTTFFTSNLTLEELEEHFATSKNKIDPIKSKRIIERIKQLTNNQIMISKNLRK